MKKYSLIKYFTLFSLITFVFIGTVLSFIISKHIRDDKLTNLKEITQITIDSITRNGFVGTDFADTLAAPKKNDIEKNVMQAMSFYDPKSIIIFNSNKSAILSYKLSGVVPEVPENVSYDNIDKILESAIPAFVSGTYYAKKTVMNSVPELVFDVYVPVKSENRIAGVMILQVPDRVISEHVNMLVKAIVLTLSCGLFILFLLLIKILYNTSKTLLNQNRDLVRQKSEIETSYKKLHDSYKNTVFALSSAVDARDPYTAGHSARVAKISVLLGKTVNITDEELINLEYAALFHDIGKIGIPDYILHKKGKLTDEERSIINTHPITSINILKTITFLTNALPIILHHHERFMGTGYPDQLKGDNIPLGSRIIAIADTYDAMTSDRPYRSALSHKTAMEEIIRNKGLQFDDGLVDVFIQIEQSIK